MSTEAATAAFRKGFDAAAELGDNDAKALIRLIAENPAAYLAHIEAAR